MTWQSGAIAAEAIALRLTVGTFNQQALIAQAKQKQPVAELVEISASGFNGEKLRRAIRLNRSTASRGAG